MKKKYETPSVTEVLFQPNELLMNGSGSVDDFEDDNINQSGEDW